MGACRRVGGDTYSPKLVFVVVQKRNHCRIFSMQGNRVDNAQPGTVVDKEITTAAQFDFYMCSHFGLKGTSRPTHYHVLCDDLALRYHSVQTRLFGVHKEQQGASREMNAPVVGTAARARGQRHVPVNLASVWGPISHAF